MRRKHNAAIERIVDHGVSGDQIIMAGGRLIADQNAVGIASRVVASNNAGR
jgi:hypothetical protein